MLLQTTLCLAAAAAVINLWLGIRISRVRMSAKILHGDGGNEALMRRMRAQANFIENVPLALILIGAIELSTKGGKWLAVVGGLFMLARLAHALGMDSTRPNPLRAGGTLVTMLTLLGLAVVAILIALGKF
ncbi:MAPEG family protein [Novosphingobium sp. JCM 18896]|uniref:MAPEG family protein n=1 Tax=Novosphingobium sp. JCM 18896 TaxID=2989731 RepID=UPI002221E757|nr:MAPEG family protein [Novosphingobium sp. JCM 18896]MCW1427965.1 MAPEG family protein [Novosphingobium sp. JCM 18896]